MSWEKGGWQSMEEDKGANGIEAKKNNSEEMFQHIKCNDVAREVK
jgi:hypothetical protein